MYELRLLCPETDVDVICEALDALDALSVSVEDADAHTEAEQPLFGEPGMPAPREGWQRSLLVALFAQEEPAREAARLLQLQDFFAGSSIVGVQNVPEQDWVRLTQSQFAPVDITPTFWIVPSWHEPPAEAQQVIRLDPGLAFGTGTHPTTRMCLRWIARNGQPGDAGKLGTVLDYGCGSGILATPLKVLAPLLVAHVAAGGHLVLAGILERQADELKEAYAPYIALEVADSEDGWILMTGRKPA